MNQNFTKFAFTDSVKKAQEHYGSRQSYARMEVSGDQYVLTSREIPFIQSKDSFYMATMARMAGRMCNTEAAPKDFLK